MRIHSNANQAVHVRCNAERALIEQYALTCALGVLFLLSSSKRKKLRGPSAKSKKSIHTDSPRGSTEYCITVDGVKSYPLQLKQNF